MKRKSLIIIPLLMLSLTACSQKPAAQPPIDSTVESSVVEEETVVVPEKTEDTVSKETEEAVTEPSEEIAEEVSEEVPAEEVSEVPDEEFNPLDHISVTYNAKEERIYVEKDHDERWPKPVSYQFDRVSDVKEGEIATLTVRLPDDVVIEQDYKIVDGNIVPVEKQKEGFFEETMEEIAKETAPTETPVEEVPAAEETTPETQAAEETAQEAAPVSAENSVVLADGIVVPAGGIVPLSGLSSAKFVVGGNETVWFTVVVSSGVYHAADDPEPDWAYEAQYAPGAEVSLADYAGWFTSDPAYNCFTVETRGSSDHEYVFHVVR